MEKSRQNQFQNSNHLEWRDPKSPCSPCSPGSPQSPPSLEVRGKSLSLNRLKPVIKENGINRELTKRGRKQRLLLSQTGGLSNVKLKRRETSPDFHPQHNNEHRTKPKREPLPMRMRALPQSFFHEPHEIQTSALSSGSTLPVLPSLFHNANNTGDDVSNLRPVTPPEEKINPRRPPKERKVSYSLGTSEDLLFKLFEPVEEDKTKKFVIKRGRPKRVQSDLTPNMLPKLEEDPTMVQNLANRLFPQLSIQNKLKPSHQLTTSLSCVSVQDGEKLVTLPSLSVDQNYSQMLLEIVAHF